MRRTVIVMLVVALALDALAASPALRQTLGANARARWARLHTLPRMAEAYLHAIADAARSPAPPTALPPHLCDDGTALARRLLAEMDAPEIDW